MTEIRRRVASGAEVTEEERATVAAYYAKYARRKKGVHLKGERAEQWTELANRQGVSLSSWIQERVDEALQRHDDAIRAVREENEKLRSGQLAVENSRLQARSDQSEAKAHRTTGRRRGNQGAMQMSWNAKLAKAPSKTLEQWATNQRLQVEWEAHVARRGAKNTQRNHRVYVAAFLRSFDALATTLEREDIEAFVSRIGTKCAKLINGAAPSCIAKKGSHRPFLHAERRSAPWPFGLPGGRPQGSPARTVEASGWSA